MPDGLALCIQNFEFDWTLNRGGKRVVDDRSVRRVFSRWFIRRKRSIGIGIAAHTISYSRLKKMRFSSRKAGFAKLSQRCYVIEYPEGTPVRGDVWTSFDDGDHWQSLQL